MSTNVAEFTYKLQLEQFSARENLSSHKARSFVKAYRQLIKTKLLEGNKIEILGLAYVYPSTRQSIKQVFDKIYDYPQQLKDLSILVDMDIQQTHRLLKSYLGMLVNKVDMGYKIQISGIFLIKPENIDGVITLTTRLSPSLEKPESLPLKVTHLLGKEDVVDVPKDKLIYRMELDKSLLPPRRIRLEESAIKESITFLDDSFLG